MTSYVLGTSTNIEDLKATLIKKIKVQTIYTIIGDLKATLIIKIKV